MCGLFNIRSDQLLAKVQERTYHEVISVPTKENHGPKFCSRRNFLKILITVRKRHTETNLNCCTDTPSPEIKAYLKTKIWKLKYLNLKFTYIIQLYSSYLGDIGIIDKLCLWIVYESLTFTHENLLYILIYYIVFIVHALKYCIIYKPVKTKYVPTERTYLP